ncbi:sodium:alanine symporter family protein [bacterium]|nr:sodium:alanine symporter family protein [bacterium]
MQAFTNFWSEAVSYAWGLPLVTLLVSAGIFFTIRSRFVPFRAMKHAIEILTGKFDKKSDPGEISHFQALMSALAATVGMGNIAGVAIAVSVGGPGAVFWMWIAGIVGMATKFFTCTLAVLFRKKDEDGIEQGGPMYYLEVGLGKHWKPLAIFFAVCGLLGTLPTFQVNQLAGLLENDYGIPRLAVGLTCGVLVAIVILGGIVRVGAVAARVVPAMILLYIATAGFIIVMHIDKVPVIIYSIWVAAFGGEALIGGAAGIALRQVIVTGVRRAAFSNEAGMGTAPMAHGAAKTKEPVREGLIAMLGPFLDTNVVCTLTALVILATGVPIEGDGVLITASAFTQAIPYGRILLTVVIVLFSVSTMISYSYYNQKCAKYLVGKFWGKQFLWVYLMSIPFAAIWSQAVVVDMMDTAFAMMSIPTLTGAILLSPKVMAATKDYFRRMKL